jgi:hypothetical protein
MGMLQPFQDCGAIIREIAGWVKRILDMPAMFVWYFKEENTLRFWRLCGRIEKTRRKETAVTLQQLRYVTAVAGADTIEQLAEYIGVEPAALSATVEQYNKVCAEGYDSDFAKDPHFLNAVAKAPFYAHVTTPSLGFALVTTGGFVTTNDQQVLNEDYQPIEGLYASGNTCGMRFGPEYITPIPGMSIGMCLTLGRELGKYLAAK